MPQPCPRSLRYRGGLRSVVFHVEVVARGLLLLVLDGLALVDAWPVVGGVSSERDVEQLEERVHAGDQRLVRCGACVGGGSTERTEGKACEEQSVSGQVQE